MFFRVRRRFRPKVKNILSVIHWSFNMVFFIEFFPPLSSFCTNNSINELKGFLNNSWCGMILQKYNKGQLFSKCLFGVFISTKNQPNFCKDFCPSLNGLNGLFKLWGIWGVSSWTQHTLVEYFYSVKYESSIIMSNVCQIIPVMKTKTLVFPAKW